MRDDWAAAEALLGKPAEDLIILGGGGNNRLYRVVTEGGYFVMKRYGTAGDDGRQRFERETAASRFLAETNLSDRIPRLIAEDRGRSAALFEWIAGEVPRQRNAPQINQMVEFLAELRSTSLRPAARQLGAAAEACFSLAELARQIDRRRDRLKQVSNEPTLITYLERFDRAWRPLRPIFADEEAVLAAEFRTLSPSDFGFHNTLCRPTGRLVFVDFEYFGWDDPVKLTADLLWHPGSELRDAAAALIRRDLGDRFGQYDPAFRRRLDVAMPAFGLRWCLILLNEFLPDRWARRQQAQGYAPTDWQDAKRRQLVKAERLIAQVEACAAEVMQ